MLTPQGIAELQVVLRGLKQNGLAIIFITHKLHEAVAVGDRVAILRQGRVVGRLDPSDLSGMTPRDLQRRIVSMMFGDASAASADIAELHEATAAPVESRRFSSEPILELVGVSAAGGRGDHALEDVSLDVRAGRSSAWPA
ncbi:MAG: hypothetical protein WKF78_00205 [Candidatus Limnocylindrales bacterium]